MVTEALPGGQWCPGFKPKTGVDEMRQSVIDEARGLQMESDGYVDFE